MRADFFGARPHRLVGHLPDAVRLTSSGFGHRDRESFDGVIGRLQLLVGGVILSRADGADRQKLIDQLVDLVHELVAVYAFMSSKVWLMRRCQC